MPALFDNFRSGTITNNPLTAAATSISSANFADLLTVAAPDYIWLVLDPAEANPSGWKPEVVKVTAHSAAATSVTCTGGRGQQGSTARDWPVNTVWIQTLTEADAQEWVRLTQEIVTVAAAAYTCVLTDRGKFIKTTNAGATAITVPTNASVPYAIGDSIDGMQYGGGQITFGGAGVTIRGTPTLKTRAQYSAWTLKKLATDEWLLTGDLASV